RLYRATALRVLAAGGDPADPETAAAAARGLDPALLDDPRLRDEAVGRAASVVAAIPAVRAALLAFQRRFAGQPQGAVLDGRDIGTVVCPDADVKLFVTASREERARRDSGRRDAPLLAAPDAVIIDSTGLDPDQVLEQASRLVTRALAARP